MNFIIDIRFELKYFVIFLVLIGFVGTAFALDDETLSPIMTTHEQYYKIEILGLEDEYEVDEEYSFYFVISGYGYSCANHQVSYPDENGNIMHMGAEVLCAPEKSMHEFKINSFEQRGTLGNTGIKKPGTYTVTVTFEKPNKYYPTTISKEFRVVESIAENFNKLPPQKQISVKITPEKVKYGESLLFQYSLPTYDKLDEERYFYNVLNPEGVQIDSTLWFAREDSEYKFETDHPAYNIVKSGKYSLTFEKAFQMERTGEIVKTAFFEITTNPPPLTQYEREVKRDFVKCNPGLELLLRYDNSPTCVKPNSFLKLVERGWAKLKDGEITSIFPEHDIENAEISSIRHFDSGLYCDKYIQIFLDSHDEGTLRIEIGRDQLDAKITEVVDDEFFVLVDKTEVDFKEIKTTESSRTLEIEFSKGAKLIDILPSCPL